MKLMEMNMGKGSTRRPMDIDAEKFRANWERIFEQKSIEQKGQVSEEPGPEHQDECSQTEEDLVQSDAAPQGTGAAGHSGENEEGIQRCNRRLR